jgi:LDH2 family malate/lactate/ureidoglycolate dehydrogenase
MRIPINELTDLTTKAIESFGYNEEETEAIREILLYAQLRGNNQGIVKLIGKGIPKDPKAGEIIIEKETPLSARINGNHNHAMIVVRKAMAIAIGKAQKSGFGIVGTHNTNTSSGAIGYFACELVRHGFVGFVFSRSPERVAMHGSYEPVFGTNPWAIGIPTEEDPLVLDMSTAAISYYGLVEAATAGKDIPGDIAYDSSGRPTTSPGEAIKGAIRSFDRGYKGSGLGMICEMMAGPLVGAAFCGLDDSKGNWGHLLFAIDPELLGDREEFQTNVTRAMEKVKASKRLPGVDEILVPGERGSRISQTYLDDGTIEIEDNLLVELRKVAQRA